jgi:hypothetical protein
MAPLRATPASVARPAARVVETQGEAADENEVNKPLFVTRNEHIRSRLPPSFQAAT